MGISGLRHSPPDNYLLLFPQQGTGYIRLTRVTHIATRASGLKSVVKTGLIPPPTVALWSVSKPKPACAGRFHKFSSRTHVTRVASLHGRQHFTHQTDHDLDQPGILCRVCVIQVWPGKHVQDRSSYPIPTRERTWSIGHASRVDRGPVCPDRHLSRVES